MNPKYSPNKYMRKYLKSNTAQRIEKRLADERKLLDLDNRYELIAQAVQRIQSNK